MITFAATTSESTEGPPFPEREGGPQTSGPTPGSPSPEPVQVTVPSHPLQVTLRSDPVQAAPPPEPVQAAPPPDAEIERLGDEIATLAAHIHAATYRLLVLIREFDERKGWGWGFRSCAHWLSWRTGIAPGPAREKVRVAGALASLPRISEAMSRGELSYSRVRAMTRVATPENEEELVNVARHTTAAHMEQLVRGWRMVDRLEDAEAEERRHQNRHLDLFPDHDGSWVLKGRLDPEVGAVLKKALEWASEALYRRGSAVDSGAGNPPRKATTGTAGAPGSWGSLQTATAADDPGADATPGQRLADAMGLLAERALAEEASTERLSTEQAMTERSPASSGSLETPSSDARRSSPSDPREETQPLPPGRADRFQVVLHVGAETLGKPTDVSADVPAETLRQLPHPLTRFPAETGRRLPDTGADVPAETFSQPTQTPRDLPPKPSAWLAEGDMGVSAETARRLSCDAGIVGMRHGPDGDVLDVGRKRRTVPPAIRRALEHRDGGCRFPGCGCRFTDAHHIIHWADGGETKLDNLILLCRRHHRALHEEGFRVEVIEGEGAEPGEFEGDGRGGNPDSAPSMIRFLRPDGRVIPEVPEPPRIPSDPISTLVRTHTAVGIDPDPQTTTPLWHGEPLDVSLALDMLRR